MRSGRQTLQEIEGTISELRRSEGQLDGTLRSAEAEVARLRQERGETLRALARVKLDALQQGEVIGPIDSTERHAMRLIEEHRSEIAGMAARIKTLTLNVEKRRRSATPAPRMSRRRSKRSKSFPPRAKRARCQPRREIRPRKGRFRADDRSRRRSQGQGC